MIEVIAIAAVIIGFAIGWWTRGKFDDLSMKILLRLMVSAIGKEKVREALAKMAEE